MSKKNEKLSNIKEHEKKKRSRKNDQSFSTRNDDELLMNPKSWCASILYFLNISLIKRDENQKLSDELKEEIESLKAFHKEMKEYIDADIEFRTQFNRLEKQFTTMMLEHEQIIKIYEVYVFTSSVKSILCVKILENIFNGKIDECPDFDEDEMFLNAIADLIQEGLYFGPLHYMPPDSFYS
ncbi:MAG: hypothetical protein ACTSRA_06475 [Promethearchaeota archaeon]